MKSGITATAASVLGVLATMTGGDDRAHLDVPPGFRAMLYAEGIDGAHHPAMLTDGTLTLSGDGPRERYEISPASDDAPVTIMRVATELERLRPANGLVAVEGPRTTLSWHPESGQLDYSWVHEPATAVGIATQTLALARKLDQSPRFDVALAPDGNLYVADARAGVIWQLSRAAR